MSQALMTRLASTAEMLRAHAAYEVSLGVVERRTGVDRRAVAAALRAPTHVRQRELQAVTRAHQHALYLAHTTLGASMRRLSRCASLSLEAVSKSVRAVEDRREDVRIDRELDELELEVLG